MHYEPAKNNHGMAHNPFNALVSPRPIGWISTISASGVVNLAPYSFYNAVSGNPPFIMFSSTDLKDSQRNAESGGEFVVNLATYELREEMGMTSEHVGSDISEFELAGLEMAPSQIVKVPRVKRSLAALECRYNKTVELTDSNGVKLISSIIIGEVVSIFIDNTIIVDGRVDITRARPLARLGYMDYAVIDEVFSMELSATKDKS